MDLKETLDAVREIDRITKDNPAILAMMQLTSRDGDKVLPAFSDAMVSVEKAALILGTTKNTIGEYVKSNLLPCWILPGQTKRKFRLSDLNVFMQTKLKSGNLEHKKKPWRRDRQSWGESTRDI